MWTHCTCNYCGHKFKEYVGYQLQLDKIRCPRCGDSNVAVAKQSDEKKDVFGYEYDGARPDAYVKKSGD